MYCSRPAVVTMHWDAWAGNFCEFCSADLKKVKAPRLIVVIEGGEDEPAPC